MKKILKLYQNFENSLSYFFSNRCDERKFLKEKFKRKKIIFLDLGCNLGTYTDLINKNLKTKKIYIFEPSKICFQFLQDKYQQKKINIYNKALSNRKKTLKFYEKEIVSQSTLNNKKSKVFNNIKNKSIYNINCISLDEFYKMNNLREIYDLIKIDCEGEDYNIIKGAKNLLKKNLIKLLKIEIEFEKNNFYEIIKYLNRFNYKLVSFTKVKFNNNQSINHIDAYFEKK
jgi:FkbM family methyltransferase